MDGWMDGRTDRQIDGLTEKKDRNKEKDVQT